MKNNLNNKISEWILWIESEKRLSLNTIISYESDLKSFLYFLKNHFRLPKRFRNNSDFHTLI